MKTMAISMFKAHALQVVDRVASSRESVIIAKRGKPLARIIPYQPAAKAPIPGKLSDALVFEKDIVTPLKKEMWEALR